MKRTIATVLLLVAATAAYGQRDDATFQSLKMSVPIGEQLPLCPPHNGNNGPLVHCWKPLVPGQFPATYDVMIEEESHGLQRADSLLVTVLGEMPKEVLDPQKKFDLEMHPTPEQIALIGKAKVSFIAARFAIEETDKILSGLQEKRGKPTSDITNKLQTGLGLPVAQRKLKWQTSWGTVGVTAPFETISQVLVYARTSEYAVLEATEEAKEKSHSKTDF